VTREKEKDILVVDDDEDMRFTLGETLRKSGYSVTTAASGQEALNLIRADDKFSLMLLDLKMPGMDGMEVLRLSKEINPRLVVIIITAHGSRSAALEAIEHGAYDYFTKPFDINELRIVIRRALEKVSLENRLLALDRDLAAVHSLDRMVGVSPQIQKVFKTIKQVAGTDVTVLITGESGTGKELVAEAIHYNSSRRDGPLVKLNCAAIPEQLLESELFGYEKGAFTGANARKPGKFELSHKGTLFLDEIGDMSLTTQAKLLRVLQERQVERLGGTEKVPIDVRIIAATNQDLEKKVKSGEFRADLFFRLNVVPIHIPPLRSRPEDILPLANYFIDRYNKKFGKQVREMSQAVQKKLLAYEWPGNVRELENAIQRGIVLAQGNVMEDIELSGVGFRDEMAEMTVPLQSGESLVSRVKEVSSQVEKKLILWALNQSQGKKGKAARLLGITRKTLYQKLQQYNIGDDF